MYAGHEVDGLMVRGNYSARVGWAAEKVVLWLRCLLLPTSICVLLYSVETSYSRKLFVSSFLSFRLPVNNSQYRMFPGQMSLHGHNRVLFLESIVSCKVI
jgi:hypothetical protein